MLEPLEQATFNVSTKFKFAFNHVVLKDPESHGVETKVYQCIHVENVLKVLVLGTEIKAFELKLNVGGGENCNLEIFRLYVIINVGF